MMKIEKLLTISDKMKDGKKKEMARVQDFDIEDMKKLDKNKFKKGKSQRGIPRLESDCLVILKDDFDDYEKEMNSQIDRLKSAIEEKNKSIESLQNRLSSIDEEHEEKINKLNEEYSDKIDGLNADLHEKDIEIEKVKTNYEKEIGDLKEKYERELGEFREKIQIDINKLKLFDEESHISIIDHQKEISDLKAEHQKELGKLNIFNPESDMKISDHNKKVNGIKDKIVIETINNKDNINELKESLSFIGFIRGKHKPIIKNMEEGNEHLKRISQYSESENKEDFQDVKKRK